MAKARRPKLKHKKATIQNQKPTFWSSLRPLLNTTTGKVIAFLTVVSTVYSIYDIYQKSVPEIHLNEGSASSPFSVHFSVENNNFLSMHVIDTECTIDYVKTKVSSITGNGHFIMSQDVTIEPHGLGQFRCPIGTGGDPGRNLINFPPDVKIESAHIFMLLKYKMLGIPRISTNTEFTWISSPPHWIEGKTSD